MQKLKLGEVCSIVKGSIGIKKAIAGEYPLVVTAETRSSCNEYHFDCKAVCIPLVSSTGHGHASLKRIHYQEGKFALGNILAAVIPNDENQLNAQYLYHYLTFYKDEKIVSLMKGAANVSLTMNSIKTIEIDVPDIDTQLKIVKSINNIKSLNNSLDKKITEQEINIEQLRKSILQEAVKGNLVPQDPNDEPAYELFKKIKDDKENFLKGKRGHVEKTLPTLNKEIALCELPENWKYCQLINITKFITDYQANGSFADLKANVQTYDDKNYAVLVRLKDLRKELKAVTDFTYTDELGYKYLSKSGLHGGEILVANVGAGTGTTLIMPEINIPATIAPNMFIVYISKFINKKYFIYYCDSIMYWNQIEILAGGTAQPKMNKTEYRSIFISVPPLEEQKRIVAKLDKLMKLCDDLEEQINQSKQYNEELLQTILNAAFSPKTKYASSSDIFDINSLIKKRALVNAEIISQLHNQNNFGSVKNEKILYLFEKHQEIDLGGEYKKMAAGPHDSDSRYKVEELLKEKQWFDITKETISNNEKVVYKPAENHDEYKTLFNSCLSSEETSKLQEIIEIFRNKTTKECEAIATLYAVWNDFLIDAKDFSDDDIVNEFRNNWDEVKQDFNANDLRDYLVWMRSKGLIPKGQGSKTIEVKAFNLA